MCLRSGDSRSLTVKFMKIWGPKAALCPTVPMSSICPSTDPWPTGARFKWLWLACKIWIKERFTLDNPNLCILIDLASDLRFLTASTHVRLSLRVSWIFLSKSSFVSNFFGEKLTKVRTKASWYQSCAVCVRFLVTVSVRLPGILVSDFW